jgi:hypothetical protein
VNILEFTRAKHIPKVSETPSINVEIVLITSLMNFVKVAKSKPLGSRKWL